MVGTVWLFYIVLLVYRNFILRECGSEYHESTPPIEAAPGFNVTFTITGLPYIESLHDHTSLLYQSASTVVTHQLHSIFRKSDINAAFTDCKVISLSATESKKTKAYAICSFNNNSAAQQVDRVIVYHQFNYNTENITDLEPYSLDRDSLYVNGYHETTSPTTQISIQNQSPPGFNVTFTITSLPYMESLHDHTSLLYQSASTIIAHQINLIYRKSDINTEFTDCKVISLSATNSKKTKAYAICSFNNNSATQQVDRVTVYHQFNYNTENITDLGPYSLDRDSLYVNGYHETTSPTTQISIQNQPPPGFNVTFTITSLPYMESLHDHTSLLYQSASTIIAHQLNLIYRKSDINTEFTDCKVISLSATDSKKTKVYANCSFNNNSAAQQVDRVTVYHQFNYNTENITDLRPYSLDRDSLYVNGYHETTSPTTQISIQNQSPPGFNVTFTITSLPYMESLHDHTSLLYQSASTIIIHQLNLIYRRSEINTEFTDCKVISLSATDSKKTKAYANCSFNNNSAAQKVDRVTVYHQFNYNTENITDLGPYSLDRDSLYVNGYHETTSPTTQISIQNHPPPGFNVTFTITSLPYMESLHDHSSLLYQSASTIIIHQLNLIYRKSDINTEFTDCKVISLSATDSKKTKVYANCSFNNNSAAQQVDRVTVYHQFNYNTENITDLGPYSLDRDSLYVNGYHEITSPTNELPVVPEEQNPLEGQKPLCFNVSFAITNLPYNPVLFSSTSLLYQSASRTITHQLNALYGNSNINAAFLDCTVISLSSPNGVNVKVQAACFFKTGPQKVDNVILKQEFRDRTNNTSTLATYKLDSNSLLITGCEELKSTVEPATPAERDHLIISEQQGDLTFQVNFTIINYNFTDELQIPSSPEYEHMTTNIMRQLSRLFENSTLKDSYRVCHITSLSPGSIKVSTFCYFDPSKSTRPVLSKEVRSEFDVGTNGSRWLGRTFQLKSDSVTAESMAPVLSDRTELPYWAIIAIVFAILLALFLITVLGLLIALCVRNKFRGFYNMLQDPLGIYYTHLGEK
ncbi:mucin-16-like [Scyliorhinus canicula]|uniref:mucin-16-like n=1 Tax=Scyliorhinus canicula TaxID=7830 RepID=UPI0018F55A3F|nr:mucin-16-like [Scyliorhinus canicula]